MSGAAELGFKTLAFTQDVSAVASKQDLAALVRRTVEPHGLSAISCAMVTGPTASPSRQFLLLDWPGDWLQVYKEERLAAIDPIPRWAIDNKLAASFTEVAGKLPPRDPGLRVVEAARTSHYGEGLLVPIFFPNRSVGIVSLGGDRDEFSPHERAFIQLVSYVAFLRVVALDHETGVPFNAKLSRRELDCLHLLVRGLSDRDMARKLAISEPTVRFHLDNARRKTGATSRTNLAALAIWLGLTRL